MQVTLLAMLALCFAQIGLAMPARAVSARLSQRDIAALQAFSDHNAEGHLSTEDADALLADLINNLHAEEFEPEGMHKRRSDDPDTSEADEDDDDSTDHSRDRPLDGLTEDALGGLRGSLGQDVAVGGGDGQNDRGHLGAGGLLGGEVLPGILKRRGAGSEEAIKTETAGGLLSIVTDTIDCLTNRALGGVGSQRSGCNGIPGSLFRRGEKREADSGQAKTVTDVSGMTRERLVSGLLAAKELDKRECDINCSSDDGLLGGILGLILQILGNDNTPFGNGTVDMISDAYDPDSDRQRGLVEGSGLSRAQEIKEATAPNTVNGNVANHSTDGKLAAGLNLPISSKAVAQHAVEQGPKANSTAAAGTMRGTSIEKLP